MGTPVVLTMACTFTAFIKAAGKTAHFEEAKEAFAEAKDLGKSHVITYNFQTFL